MESKKKEIGDYNTSVPAEIIKSRDKYISERWEQLYNVSTEHAKETIQYLFIVNAGGTGALLGFLGVSEKARSSGFLIAALCCFSAGLVLVGILRVFIVHHLMGIFERWKKDVSKYYMNQITYDEITSEDDRRTGSDKIEFTIGYLSGILFIVGLVLGSIGLFDSKDKIIG